MLDRCDALCVSPACPFLLPLPLSGRPSILAGRTTQMALLSRGSQHPIPQQTHLIWSCLGRVNTELHANCFETHRHFFRDA